MIDQLKLIYIDGALDCRRNRELVSEGFSISWRAAARFAATVGAVTRQSL
jgi:hypothetical protein